MLVTHPIHRTQVFSGNADGDTVVRNALNDSMSFVASLLRIYPLTWSTWPCLRVEVFGRGTNTVEPPLTSDLRGNCKRPFNRVGCTFMSVTHVVSLQYGSTTRYALPRLFYSPSHSYHMDCVELSLKGRLCIQGVKARTFGFSLVPGFAMLMKPNKAETSVHGYHCSGDIAVRMRKVLAIPRSCVV